MNKKVTWGLIVTGLIAFGAIYSQANAFTCFCHPEDKKNPCIQVYDKNVNNIQSCAQVCAELKENRKLSYDLKASETNEGYEAKCELFENMK